MFYSTFRPLALIASLTMGQGLIFADDEQPMLLDTIPPSDAGRGLLRTGPKEIRHYGGGAGQGKALPYIISRDNGKNWSSATAGAEFPKKWGGIFKEAAATVYLPYSKRYMIVQPVNGYIFISDDIDKGWYAPAKDGRSFVQADVWKKDQSKLYPLPGGWIYRNPLELKSGRIIIPMHKSGSGTRFLMSADKGKTWTISKDTIFVPAFKEEGIDKATRWRNAGVEGTAVELKNGQIYALVRTDSNMSYESFSRDGGNTWSKPEPSPFYGSLIMSTLGRLADGQLICLWTNTAPMPELAHRGGAWEDVFTARGALHVALSRNEGKSWYGYREVVIDGLRDAENFASKGGDHDRSSHQSEFVELDKRRILVTSGQHPSHRKMIIIDKDWIEESSRTANFAKDGMEQVHSFVFIPKAHHIQYNRKSGVERVNMPGGASKGGLKFGILNDDSLINAGLGADYRRSGVTWNFPLARTGLVKFELYFPKGSCGMHVSLTDRMFNPCDPTAPQRAVFSYELTPDKKLGELTIKEGVTYKASLLFKGSSAKLTLTDMKRKKRGSVTLRTLNSPKVGISYLHFIAAEDNAIKNKSKAMPVGDSKFFRFKDGSTTLEKSCIVSDFQMKMPSKKSKSSKGSRK